METLKGWLFKKPADRDPRRAGALMEGGRRAGEAVNPYLAARRTWNGHTASVVSQNVTLRIALVMALMVALAAVGGLITIGQQSKFIPYVVEVDKHGGITAQGPVEAAQPVDPRVIRAAVADFIGNARLVTPDMAIQRKAVFALYAMLAPNDPATSKMNEFLNGTEESSPFKRAANEMVSVDAVTVLQQTPDTWQVDWTETTRDRQGVARTAPVNWRALVTVYVIETTEQTTEDQERSNPLGIYVRDFSWSRLQ